MDEAHVKHSVGFVQNKELNMSDVDVTLIDQVEQAARCCNENVQSLLQSSNLWVLIDTSKDDLVTNVQMFTVGVKPLINLGSKFPCW